MLYVTTRDNTMTFSAQDTLSMDSCTNGGYFVPQELPVFTHDMLRSMQASRFSSTVADVLNLLFSLSFSSWDVDFSIGRSVAKFFELNRKVTVAELWHNPERSASSMVKNLHEMLCQKAQLKSRPTNWSVIAVHIAVYAGLYGQMVQNGLLEEGETMDLSLSSADFSEIMAAWYAKKMRLPIGNILCACLDDKTLWNAIHLGEYDSTSGGIFQGNIERLVYGALGADEAAEYVKSSGFYAVPKDRVSEFNDGLFVAVVGTARGESVMRSLSATNQYAMSLDSALCYGAIQDYRSKTGESRHALLIAKEKP